MPGDVGTGHVEPGIGPEAGAGREPGTGLRHRAVGWMTAGEQGRPLAGDVVVRGLILVIEYAIVLSLLVLAGIVLVRSLDQFITSGSTFPDSVVPAVDGILVVIILLDIVQTVFRHLRSAEFPVRPFLVIGILAGVRGILSASAHLTLVASLTTRGFDENVIELGVGVGVVVALLAGLYVYDRGQPAAEE